LVFKSRRSVLTAARFGLRFYYNTTSLAGKRLHGENRGDRITADY
jgi:hypothetical protein